MKKLFKASLDLLNIKINSKNFKDKYHQSRF